MLQVTEELLKEMTDLIVREVKPRKIILFGSHARGTARADSDLDFLVVEDGPFNAQPRHLRSRCFLQHIQADCHHAHAEHD